MRDKFGNYRHYEARIAAAGTEVTQSEAEISQQEKDVIDFNVGSVSNDLAQKRLSQAKARKRDADIVWENLKSEIEELPILSTELLKSFGVEPEEEA